MARELRNRKVATDSPKSQKPTTKATEKASKVKRKAAEDASPVSSKKQKASKPTSARGKATDKPSKADELDKADKSSKADKAGKPSKSEKPSKIDKAEKPSKTSEADRTKKPTKSVDEAASTETALDPEEQEDDGMLLLADELDSGDEEVAGETTPFEPGQDVGKIPTISGDVLKAAKPSGRERGVIYIGRIPHGFYEHEMRQYLSQFGPVSRVRLSRNKKTGASKHFAFVEFEDENTAEIVTKTMDNYLLFGHILKVKMVPKSQIHEDLFKGANRRFKKVPWNKMAGQKLAKPRSQSAWETKVERERANRAQRADKLKAIGYEFEAPDLKEVPAVAPAEDAETKVEPIAAAPTSEDEESKGAEEEAAEDDVEMTQALKTKAPKRKGTKSGKSQKAKA